MKIIAIDYWKLPCRAIKESWDSDESVWPDAPPSFLVRITGEDGVTGVGEVTSQVWYLGETAEQIAGCLALYAQALVGQDATNIARAHQIMERTYAGGMPGGRGARSAVDMALYDLVGKAKGLSVHALLGGAYRTRLDLLTNLYHKTPESMAQACKDFVARGFKGLKIKVGDTLLHHGFSMQRMEQELEFLQAALEVTPRDVYIDADANQGWRNAKWTVAKLARFEEYDNLSIEQPLAYADLAGARHVREHARTPVILDESIWSVEAMSNAIAAQACDRIVLKINRVGGFFPAQQIIALCTAAGIGVSVDTNPFTLVGDTACAHIAAIIKDHYPVDCEGHVSFLTLGRDDVFQGGVAFDQGQAIVPVAPGLGVEVDWDVVEGIAER